jgi:hypothetical protein
MPEREDIPALEDEPSKNARHHDDGADYLNHVEPTAICGPVPVTVPASVSAAEAQLEDRPRRIRPPGGQTRAVYDPGLTLRQSIAATAMQKS